MITGRALFPELYQLLSTLFYQGWDDFYHSIDETVRDSWPSTPQSEKESIRRQLAAFIEIVRASDAPQELLREMNCDYNAKGDDTTVVEFLEKLDRLLV